jgi:hypothetical protein
MRHKYIPPDVGVRHSRASLENRRRELPKAGAMVRDLSGGRLLAAVKDEKQMEK